MTEGNSPGWRETARQSLQSVAAPIFAATLLSTKPNRLTVHVPTGANRKTVVLAVKAAVGPHAQVRFHSPASLTSPRSLERLVRRFACDDIVYDPTQSMTRAKALVDGAAAVRASLCRKVSGLFYAPRQRTLYVALNSSELAVGDKIKVAELAVIERSIVQSMREAFAGKITECPAVRVGFGIPRTELVPVDQMSAGGPAASFGARIRRFWKPAAIAALLGFGAAGSAAASDPAVSAPNLKVVGEAGQTNNDTSWLAGGGLTLPIGHSWGALIEGAAANVGGDSVYGGAAHLFTRNPDSYLLGLFAAYANEEDFGLESTRVGAEAEIYMDQISVLAKAGYQFNNGASTSKGGVIGDVELKWYVTDNFAMSAGASVHDKSTFGHATMEYQPGFSALPGLAFRVDGTVGEDDYHSILGGITYYFGADASLKDRHRRQDPDLELIRLFKQVEAERDKLCAQYGCP
jgi:hypothetical protein